MRHGEVMRRAAVRYLRDRHFDVASAEDAVSTVVKRLLECGVPADVNDWEGYLIRAAINAAKDIIKMSARRRDQLTTTGDLAEACAELTDDSMEEVVVAAIDNQRAFTRVCALLDTLPAQQCRAVRGRLLEGKQNTELARELEVSSQYVSQLYSAGMRALVAGLTGDMP